MEGGFTPHPGPLPSRGEGENGGSPRGERGTGSHSPIGGVGQGEGVKTIIAMRSSGMTTRARQLRRRQTDAERLLWSKLRSRQLEGRKVRRQYVIGSYIVDFVFLEDRLVVELDGGQHAEQVDRDARRTAWLEMKGFRVLRFWNHEVLANLEGVLEVIRQVLLEKHSRN